LEIKDISIWKYYEIRYLNFNDELYLRPIKIYNCAKFEETFGFGAYCEGFTKNKIIRVRQLEIDEAI
jgi:hypothetical protein